MKIDPRRWKTKPRDHQVIGVQALVDRSRFALFDEMGVGKSKQIVDAACELAAADVINTVVVVTPGYVRNVWLSADLDSPGEIKKHSWYANKVIEYHSSGFDLIWEDVDLADRRLPWVVTNYEFLRNEARLQNLIDSVGDKALLVLDESSYLANHKAQQTKATRDLRKVCARCYILNGTPVSNSPLDLWSQMDVLDPKILGRAYQNFWHFRNSIAQWGGWENRTILQFYPQEIERLQRLIKPHCLRRLKRDCLDLPPKIGGLESDTPLLREVKLGPKAWKIYCELRREAILALPDRDVIPEPNAGVRLLRLSQICGGHVSHNNVPLSDDETLNLFELPGPDVIVEEISDEKLLVAEWMVSEVEGASIVWCRFRPERERLVKRLQKLGIKTYQVYGGQKDSEREAARVAFSGPARAGRMVLVGQMRAGGMGLNLTRATDVVYLSNDDSLKYRLQSEDRSHRDGTVSPVTYTDLIATGPDGQKTVDAIKFKALRAKEDLSAWTCRRWRRALEETA